MPFPDYKATQSLSLKQEGLNFIFSLPTYQCATVCYQTIPAQSDRKHKYELPEVGREPNQPVETIYTQNLSPQDVSQTVCLLGTMFMPTVPQQAAVKSLLYVAVSGDVKDSK